MAVKILTTENLQAWIDKLVTSHEVFAPVKVQGQPSESSEAASTAFKQIKAGQKPALNIRTSVSPKGILFKQVEKMLSYERNDSDVTISETLVDGCSNKSDNVSETTVLFGVRPCDARSFILTDKPFIHSDMPEKAYSARRDNSITVTYACDNACKTCFCTSVGGSPVEKTGDVWMLSIGDRYLVEALTPRGEQLLAISEGLFTDSSSDDRAKAKEISDKVADSMEVLPIPSADALDKLFKDEGFWKELTEKCLSCGACTFICPTCYCFDVRDEGNTNTGDRYRRWDSCMFFQYNRAAGGHNPRDSHWKRMRQRMLHKFCYFVEKYGDIDCVGCGRCVRSCPVSYDIRDFIKKSFIITGGSVSGSGAQSDFKDTLPNENEEPFICEVKPAAENLAETKPVADNIRSSDSDEAKPDNKAVQEDGNESVTGEGSDV